MGTSAAVAVVLIKEKHIVEAFRQAGATSSNAAVTPAALGVHERLAFSKLRRRNVLREAGPGLFYLDETAWTALRRFRHRAAVVIALVLVAFAIVSAIVTRQTR